MHKLAYILLSVITSASLAESTTDSKAMQATYDPLSQMKASKELTVIQRPKLKPEEIRFFSNLIWQRQPGSPVTIKLLPLVNASQHDSYQVNLNQQSLSDLESKTIPSALDTINQQLVNQTAFLQTVNHSADYQLQFIVQDYQTLYSLTGSDNWLDYSIAKLDQAWSAIAGDNKPSQVKVTMVLYDKDGTMLLQMPMGGALSPCQRSANPMVFPSHQGQAFLNGFAKTTTGQTYIAVINRTLTEVAKYLADTPINGEVLRVEQNNIYLNLGQGIVYPEETVHLIYQENPQMPSYPVGRLEVESVYANISIAHAIDVHTANVLPGDKVQLKKPIQARAYVSAGKQPVSCS